MWYGDFVRIRYVRVIPVGLSHRGGSLRFVTRVAKLPLTEKLKFVDCVNY